MARILLSRSSALRHLLVATLVFVLLSPTLLGLGPRGAEALPADMTDPRYLCARDLPAALSDLAAPGTDEGDQAPPFQDPRCSLCIVLARAVCPELVLTAPVPVPARAETLRRLEPEAPVLASLAPRPRARAPPASF